MSNPSWSLNPNRPLDTPRSSAGPTVGRAVHYVWGAQCRAATVTEVGRRDKRPDEDVVGLCVLNPTEMQFLRNVRYDPGTEVRSGGLCDGLAHGGDTWHWPAKV